jgi:hypothetical protein
MPTSETRRPDAEAQTGQDQAKAGCLEAELGARGSDGRPNERCYDGGYSKSNLKPVTKDRTPEAGQTPFEVVTDP